MLVYCMSALSRNLYQRATKSTLTSITLLLQNAVITMYDKCGSLVDARKIFDHLTEPDAFSWNMIIAAHRRHGFPQEAFTLFHQMQRTAVQPDQFSFSAILPVCAELASLNHGLQIHGKIIRCGFQSNVIVMNTLIDMYAKCGSMQKARELFDKMHGPDVVSWNAMITGYAQNGAFDEALTLFRQMQLTAVQPNHFTFSSIVPVCGDVASLKHGLQIHGKIVRHGYQSDAIVQSAVIDMYAKCGSMEEARELFDKMRNADTVSWNAMITGYAQNGALDDALGLFKQMPQRNVVSWNAIIAGCAQNGLVEKAMEFFKQMQSEGIKPSSTTLPTILPLCAKMGALEQGMEIHVKIIESGFLSDVVVATALIDMYAKCRSIQKARKLFDQMHNANVVSSTVMITGYAQNGVLDEALRLFNKLPHQNVVSWTAIIAGYAQNGFEEKALEIFKQMHSIGVKSNSPTFATILPACAKMGALVQGMEIHQKIIESGYASEFSDVIVVTALIDMYAKCGSIRKAYRLFDKMPHRDVASWTAIITGYAQIGFVEKALQSFKQMQLAGVKPNSATFASILPLCAKMGALEQGMEFHRKIIESGFLSAVAVVTALIDMYAKCRNMEKAYRLFDKIPQRDVTSWTVIIAGYAQNGHFKNALKNFKQMQLEDKNPDSLTFASILPVCAKLRMLKQGMEIHQKVIESNFLSDVVLTALIYMYAKCGSIQKGRVMFDKMTQKNVVSWNAMIVGYTHNGLVDKALEIFRRMLSAGVKPDSSTFVSILPACAKHGALEHGMEIHQKIIKSGYLSDLVANALKDMYAK